MVQLLDIFFPRFCIGCGKIGQYFCSSCQKRIHKVELSETICPVCEHCSVDGMTHHTCKTNYTLDGLISFFHYDSLVKKAIIEIKYRFVSDIVKSLLLLKNNDQLLSHKKGAFLVPIPLHPTRLRFRGFNQAALVSNMIGMQLDIPVIHGMLIRTVRTVPQVEMHDRKQRLQNMKHVFAIDSAFKSEIPKSVLLVDDVFTTGATLTSACKTLKLAGVTSVWGLTIAR